MSNRKLHIVSFDVPYPPDYGGAIDVFYKIKALSEVNVDVYLHCFQYGRDHSQELEKLCKEVWYYPRSTGIQGISLILPYIIYSRRNSKLLQRLKEIDAPILFEGAHTTYYLNHPALKDRFKAIRVHNIEHEYYDELYKKEQSPLKKYYYKTEGRLLKSYEASLSYANAFFPLSMADTEIFAKQYPASIHQFIAPFHPYNQVESKTGKGDYCIYHGNLSHPENREAVLFLLKNVFPEINMQVIIAGKKPASDIVDACRKLKNCRLIADPSATQMEELIAAAHIHVLPTFQATGMKLKLLYALFHGRHVLVNDAMLHGTGLNKLCSIANSAEQFHNKINNLKESPFTEQDIVQRNIILMQQYSNAINAEKIATRLSY